MRQFLLILFIVFIFYYLRGMFDSDSDQLIQEIKNSTEQQKILNEGLHLLNEKNSFDYNFNKKKILVKVIKIEDPFAISVDYNELLSFY